MCILLSSHVWGGSCPLGLGTKKEKEINTSGANWGLKPNPLGCNMDVRVASISQRKIRGSNDQP